MTSDQETLSSIDHVEAVFPSSEIISGNIAEPFPLNAVDAQGNVLPGFGQRVKHALVTTKTSSSTSSSGKVRRRPSSLILE